MKSKIRAVFKKVIISMLVIATGILPSISNISAAENITGYVWHDDWFIAFPETGSTGEPESQLLVNGEDVFCIDPYTYYKPNVSMDIVDWSTVGISHDMAYEISLIGYFGTKISGRTDANWIAVTQGLIWKTLHPNDPNMCYVTTPLNPDFATTQKLWNQILADVEKYKTIPSFSSQTVEVDAGSSITLTDTNGVLSDMYVSDSAGLDITISGNQLIIKGATNSADLSTITLKKKINEKDIGTSLVFYNGRDQSLAQLKVNDPISAKLKVKVNKFGELELTKFNEDKSAIVENTTYRITGPNGYDKTFTTDSNGKIKVEKLRLGEYTAVETKAGNGYLVNVTAQNFTIVANQTTSIEFANVEPTGKITLTKSIDTSKTNGLSGDAHLKNNSYALYAKEKITNKAGTIEYFQKGEKVSTKKTDVNGYIEWDNLPLGSYYIQESQTNETLTLNNTTINVTLTYQGQTINKVVSEQKTSDKVNMQKIRVFKSGEKDSISGLVKGLQGASFTFKLYSEVNRVGWDDATTYAVITTDVNGEAVTPYLPNGQYVVRETTTPDEYITAPDFLISITDDYSEYKDVEQIKNVNVNNRPFTSQIKLIKVDEDTGKTVTLNSASFKIKDSQGNYVVQKVGGVKYDTFTTNSTNTIVIPFGNKGEVTIPLALDAGEYVIEEIKVPNGFLALEEPVKFNISNVYDYDVDEDDEPILVVTVKNKQPKATIQLTKSFESSGHIDNKVAKFELQVNKEIKSVIDGSVLYKKGQVIKNSETEDGYYYVNAGETLTINNLPIGVNGSSYALVEVETTEGYVLSNKPIIYDFNQVDETTNTYKVSKALDNKLIRTDIEVAKTDAYSKEIVKDIEGFVFEMEMSFTHSDNSMEVTTKQVAVDPKTGKATFKDVPYGAVVSIKEVEVGKDYYLSEEVKTFVVDKNLSGIGKVHTFTYDNIPVEKIKTSAWDTVTNDNQGASIDTVLLTDTVTYKDLSLEKEYTIKGVLMDKETGGPLLVEDKEITAEVTFTPTEHDGTIDLVFTAPASVLEGKTTVVFERLYTDDKEVASHSDIEDENQTVYYPSIQTTAKDEATGTNQGAIQEEVTIIDTVKYTNLIVGNEYTVKGMLMDKDTNKPFLVDQKEVHSEVTFIADKENGTIDLSFTISGAALIGKTVVVFEDVYYQDKHIATHSDIEDESQTIYYPEIETTALDKNNGTHNTLADKEVTIVDTVRYENLLVGKEYTVSGVLMNKATNKPLLVNGKEVTATTTFVAETTSGAIDLEFTFDANGLGGTTVVVFERLCQDNIEVASHTDINDLDQSVNLTQPKTPLTGDNTIVLPCILFGLGSIIIYYGVKRSVKKNKKEEDIIND